MKNDFEMIVRKMSEDLDSVNIYPLGDLHIGSADFDVAHWNVWKKRVMDDPKGYVVIVGDLLDNGLKDSKTNSYQATMRPFEQKKWLSLELGDIRDKIIGATQGNHEYRSSNLSDDCPLYDVMAKLDLEDLYRENMAFLKVTLGKRNAERQWAYTIVLGHGASKTKVEKFSYAIDGMDVLVTGHTHTPSVNFPTKIVIDSKNNHVGLKEYTHLVVPSFASFGGYALKAMYLPQNHKKIPMITLDGTKKGVYISWV